MVQPKDFLKDRVSQSGMWLRYTNVFLSDCTESGSNPEPQQNDGFRCMVSCG